MSWIRKCTLVVSTGSDGLDLSQLRIEFKVRQFDYNAPNTAVIRVWNLADETARQVQEEFERVTLQAGYEDEGFGIIFDGTIKQVIRGRANAKDKYVEIMAADGDLAHNFALVNKTLKAGSTPKQRAAAIAEATSKYDVKMGDDQHLTGGILPRGRVLFGLPPHHLDNLGETTGTTWTIQDGKIEARPLRGTPNNEAIVLTAQTGLVGVPEATNNGIEIVALLNPRIKVWTKLQIDNESIRTLTARENVGYPNYTSFTFPARTADDGIYRAIVVDHEGDTRGQPWYTLITALDIDKSTSEVKPYG